MMGVRVVYCSLSVCEEETGFYKRQLYDIR